MPIPKSPLELEFENEALRKDAERYRWITRSGKQLEIRIPATESKQSIDAAIDKELELK